MPQTITFSELPLGTVNPVYLAKGNAVRFTGEIVTDSAQPTTPAFAHDTSHTGLVQFTFDKAVDSVEFDAGSFNALHSTTISVFDQDGHVLSTVTNSQFGIQHFSYTPGNGTRIALVQILNSATDPAGFSIDNVKFTSTPPIEAKATTAPVGALSVNDINGILWGGYKWDHTNFTYSFPTSTAEYLQNGYQAIDDFVALSATQQTAVTKILGMYSAVCGITFTKVTTPEADFRFGVASKIDTGDGWGLHIPGGGGGTAEANPVDPDQAPTAWGDNWFSNIAVNTFGNDNSNPVLGNFIFTAAFMHEIGHNLGLKHGHITQSFATGTFPMLPADHNSQEYSIMTYDTYPGGQGSTDQYPETPMLDDIAALQYLYGANYSTNAGNTVYTFDPATGEYKVNGVGQGVPGQNHILMTVWDGGGNDTYDFSNYATDLTVNLQPGEWTNLGGQLASLGGGHMARGNIANAYEFQGNVASLIENAIGGSGNDTLYGNDIANQLDGGGGANTLHGYGGNDYLTATASTGGNYAYGEAGNDQLFFASGTNNLLGGTGDDWLGVGGDANAMYGENGADWLGGTGNSNTFVCGGGNDTVSCTGSLNYIYGDDGSDSLYVSAGAANHVNGNNGNDWLGVNGTNNVLNGGAGNDWIGASGTGNMLQGGGGGDTLFAIGSNNALSGQGGGTWIGVSGDNNALYGANGSNDWLGATGNFNFIDPGSGNDTIVLAAGHAGDVIVYRPGYGQDTIDGFIAAGGGHDTIDLRGFGLTWTSLIDAYASDTASGATLTLAGSASTLTLLGLTKAALLEHDFLLA